MPTSASDKRVHADTWICAPLHCAPLPFTAVKSSSCTGSSTTACVISSSLRERDRDRVVGKAVDEIDGAVDRIDDPAETASARRPCGSRRIPRDSTACSGNAAAMVAAIALSASVSADDTMSPCSLENVGSRRRSRDASMMTLAARRAARTATASTGSLEVFIGCSRLGCAQFFLLHQQVRTVGVDAVGRLERGHRP